MGALGQSSISVALIFAAMAYVGADFPGSRPVIKKVAKVVGEPRDFINKVFLFTGVGGLLYVSITEGIK
jgi:hypothetical protein